MPFRWYIGMLGFYMHCHRVPYLLINFIIVSSFNYANSRKETIMGIISIIMIILGCTLLLPSFLPSFFTYLLTYLLNYLFTYLSTYSMEKSPSWKANRFASSQEIHCILWNPKVHYPIHNCPPPVSILSQPNPVHTPTSHFLKIHLNVLLSSTPGFPHWSLSLRFSHRKLVHASPLSHPSYIPRPSHSSRCYHSHSIGWGVQIMKLLIMTFSPLPLLPRPS
jgi:hypothetical protein